VAAVRALATVVVEVFGKVSMLSMRQRYYPPSFAGASVASLPAVQMFSDTNSHLDEAYSRTKIMHHTFISACSGEQRAKAMRS
jgi:hypothetical protein